MKYTFLLFTAGITALLSTSCDTAPAPEVAYIIVDTLVVSASGGQGTSSSKINTFWVEQNGAQIGAFIPPCEVPVLAGDDQEIRIIPGISINGSYTQRNQYEMLNAKTFNWDLAPYSKRALSQNQSTFTYNNVYTLVSKISTVWVWSIELLDTTLRPLTKVKVHLSTLMKSQIKWKITMLPLPLRNSERHSIRIATSRG